uniref:Uncharacterized protein n=1 Tax=Cacopsylla melanoneura TaxID=428564 RepID=A0A8D9BA56_9HEMI
MDFNFEYRPKNTCFHFSQLYNMYIYTYTYRYFSEIGRYLGLYFFPPCIYLLYFWDDKTDVTIVIIYLTVLGRYCLISNRYLIYNIGTKFSVIYMYYVFMYDLQIYIST